MARLSDRDRMLRAVTEGELERHVTALARANGWLAHHERRSTYATGDQGFPDWTFAREGRVIFAELKRETESPWAAQERWLATLATGPAEVYVWRPSDWYDGRIGKILGDGNEPKRFRLPELPPSVLLLPPVRPRRATGLRPRGDGR